MIFKSTRFLKRFIRSPKKNAGFTLIELVIVFSVLSILSVLSMVSLVSYSRQRTIGNDANNILSVINLAKSNTASQYKPSTCAGKVFNGYYIIFDTIRNSYKLYAACPDHTSNSNLVNTYPLSKNITFDTGVGKTDLTKVYFNIISGGIELNGDSSITTAKVVLTGFGGTQTRTINFCSDGRILQGAC